jgi:hypothetical protein
LIGWDALRALHGPVKWIGDDAKVVRGEYFSLGSMCYCLEYFFLATVVNFVTDEPYWKMLFDGSVGSFKRSNNVLDANLERFGKAA